MAAAYGHLPVVELLLDRGLAPDTKLRFYGTGHTALHLAAFHGRVDLATALLRRGASVHEKDESWEGTPLLWALYSWKTNPGDRPERFHAVVGTLLQAGARVEPDMLKNERVQADPTMLAILSQSHIRAPE
jgi:ankyrin repeat protein